MTYRPFLAVTSVAIAAVLVGLGVHWVRGGPYEMQARTPSVPAMGDTAAAIPQGRTVALSRGMPKPTAGPVLGVRLVRGRMPHGATRAVVISDTDCTPDAHGISRCLDRLRLASGRMITVRHVHDMRETRCLTPGEHVRVVPARLTAA